MNITKLDSLLLRSKFRGCMLGVLSGDCLGAPYENDKPLSRGEKVILQKSFDKLEGIEFKAPVMQFTDDSAMTRSLAQSLIEKRDLDVVDVAKKFVKAYYYEANRGYGQGVITVFQKLRGNKFKDVFKPASEQFNGQGSLGNGGAMRIAPIALYCYNNYDELVDMARTETELTHTHNFGVNGAILQAIAIQQSLELDPNEALDPSNFIDRLVDKIDKIEIDDEEFLEVDRTQSHPYKHQLSVVKKIILASLINGKEPNTEEVITKLGNNVTAVDSVPTAIYCFLRAQMPIDGIKTDNQLRRAIQYAITLGGDTDTIASMTGALAGAFYGDAKISPALLKHCEASSEFAELGNKLFDIAVEKTK